MEEVQTAANAGEVANSQTPEGTVASPEATPTPEDVTQTQVFAHRLKEATTAAEQKARDSVIAEMYGKSHGIHTYADYQEAVRKHQEAQERQRMEDAGLDPELIRSAIDRHPVVQRANEVLTKQEQDAKFQAEAKELFAEFPDLKPEQIPAEVWKLQQDKGLSLLDAFLRVSHKNLTQQAEQAAIQKLQTNAQSSTGSLSGGDVNHVNKISQMSKDEFKKLEESVLRGEVKKL